MEYDYRKAIIADIMEYIEENYAPEEIAERMSKRYEWEQELNDDTWCADSVTGNASGSYFFNRWSAEDALTHNWDLLENALLEFGCTDCNPIERGAEWCDVTIRCYLLGECIAAALDELAEELFQC